MSERKWFAVYTKPRREKKVAELLTRKEIENYCPLNKVMKQWADRKKIVYEPLFNSYVFIRIAESDHYKFRNTDGIINLVHWLGKPAVIRDIEIDMIQRFLGEHDNVTLEKTPVNVNDLVRVISGPLLEQQGQVVAVKGKKVRLILPSLGYMMSAEIETEKIEVLRRRLSSLDNSCNLAVG